MSRSRIIVETSDQKKTAVLEAASLQGATLAEWFEEQLRTTIPSVNHASDATQHALVRPDELNDVEAVMSSLSSQDWAFTDDDTRYLTHDLHPYPAKFIPQIPAHLIARLSMPGDRVFDPFGGSATTAVEAVRLGRRATSIDANPLSALIGRVKTGYMTPSIRADLEQLAAAVESRLVGPDGEVEAQWPSVLERHGKYCPEIPNIEKWFDVEAQAALCLLRHLIDTTTRDLSRDAALLALSRIILRVSNQESETRYVSVKKNVSFKVCLRAYLESLRTAMRRLDNAAAELQYADAEFVIGDSRADLQRSIAECSVDLIVTSPPYPNATDYHLYHRFRLFWLGFDPRKLGQIEIGSHLRHQRNNSGFEEYHEDMVKVLSGCAYALAPGRFAVFVVGDALFKGESFSTASAIAEAAEAAGLRVVGTVDRPIHTTKRSFAKPARRARLEQLVVLQKPNHEVVVSLGAPAYKMWNYEVELRAREITALTNAKIDAREAGGEIRLKVANPDYWNLRRLAFTRDYSVVGDPDRRESTWQKVLENGDADPSKRKDPKYGTHGLHAYKGKFYPQLAKSLLNISGVPVGGRILDPYCGSGTTLVEAMLNGFAGYGCDFNPLAAKIAKAKTGILTLPRHIVDHAIRSVLDRVVLRGTGYDLSLDQFSNDLHRELHDWFPEKVLFKLNWLLAQIRLLGNPTIVDFLEVTLSSVVRDVSQQDPSDLRIRRRKAPLEDAPVFELFADRLTYGHSRLQKYWAVAGRQPGDMIEPRVVEGDSRAPHTAKLLGLERQSVDAVVTSPPYATALPYIDTDRLSLLAIMGIPSKIRSTLEENLTGSREIRKSERDTFEATLMDDKEAYSILPKDVVSEVRFILRENSKIDVGFRRANMPALLWRYYVHMKENLESMHGVMRPGARAFYVVGDSRTNAGGNWVKINTCANISKIAQEAGFRFLEAIDIDVTTENYKHIHNAITENQILVFERP
ncbi:DNA methyltransferase [Paracoccus sphaerophysae]|uniref:DNA methyltransferase n=1 Tax=Paracoccus sphaerophysae TaxID=690417 RepID=UPI000A02FADE|nr:DNA methyltransferase [Paracoccus sphaerophysae]